MSEEPTLGQGGMLAVLSVLQVKYTKDRHTARG